MRKKIIESFREPVKNSKNIIDLLIGGVLSFFPVINFIAIGFLGEKLKKNIEQDKTPVKWDGNVKKLFNSGLLISCIGILYLFIPFLLVFLGGVFMMSLSDGRILSMFYFRGQILNLVGMLILLPALYMMFFAIPVFLECGNIRKSFDVKLIADKIIEVIKEYTVAYAVILGLMVISAITILLLTNAVIGCLLSGFILFYNGWVITNLLSKFFPRQSVNIFLHKTKK